jgi:hypothetical protein
MLRGKRAELNEFKKGSVPGDDPGRGATKEKVNVVEQSNGHLGI